MRIMNSKESVVSKEEAMTERGGEIVMGIVNNRKLAVSKAETKNNTRGGETVMRKLIVVMLMLLVSGIASALTTDSVILTVTPNFNLSVNISSDTYGFGNITLGSSKTVCIGQIMNDGNVSSKWQKQVTTQSDCVTAGGKWSLVSGNGNNPGSNQFKLLAVTTGTTVLPVVAAGGTGFGDSCIAGNHDFAAGIGVSGSMTDLTEGGVASPNHPKSELRKLWVSLLMPTDATVGDQQTITLSVQAKVQ